MRRGGRQRLPRTLATLVTSAGTLLAMLALPVGSEQALATAGPGQAGTATWAGAAAVKRSPAGTQPDTLKAAEAHYTNVPCNTSHLKKNVARCFAIVRTALNHQITASANQPPSGALGPADIQSAYHLPATGAGQTVAIVNAYGDSSAESDLAAFRSYYGLPPCTTANGCFQKVNQTGGTSYPPDNSGWGLETSLDLDAVSSACPNCHILLVEGNSAGIDDLGTAVDEAVALGAKFVSNSYGVNGEFSGETSYDSYYNHPGVAVTVASGDSGYGAQDWPASNPNVTAVGGTTLTKDTATARGWDETAWAGSGSGCSPYEPHPDYQNGISADCPANKALADISADADPNTGLGVYDTLGYGGWLQVGGTSMATPLITSMYALAGTPAAGTYPVTYPYQAAVSDLNDITQGSTGSCGTVLCNAGPGWDGPTGLGTPNGVAALTTGPHGDIAGQVTDQATSKPIADATVSVSSASGTTTDSVGKYDLNVPVGAYDVTTSAFGYKPSTQTGVQVSQGKTTTQNFALAPEPHVTLSGKVTDGSGQNWPLYAEITINGDPNTVYTNPYTGAYSVTLPRQNTYTLQVTPVHVSGYVAKNLSVQVGTANKVRNIKLGIDPVACDATGYTSSSLWSEGFDTVGTTPPDGWSVTDHLGQGFQWTFNDPENRRNQTGGQGNFAIADALQAPSGSEDTVLTSPVFSLAKVTKPVVTFDTNYSPNAGPSDYADVDLSIDGGQSWASIWQNTTGTYRADSFAISIPRAVGQSQVELRFHFVSDRFGFWEVDNVGVDSCNALTGGLVAGTVTDANTSDGLDGATVASVATSAETTTTAAAPGAGDGFYELFAAGTGSQQFTTSDGRYVPATASVSVTANSVTRQNFSLQAGRINVSAASLSSTVGLGNSASRKVTFTNNGTASAHVTLAGQDDGFTPMDGNPASTHGAPLQLIQGHFAPGPVKPQAVREAHGGSGIAPRKPEPSDPPWTSIADYPTPIAENATAYNDADGKVYSVGGWNGSEITAASYVYDPVTQDWSPIAAAPQRLLDPVAAFTGGTLYLIGGWYASGYVSPLVYTYDPATNTWSQVASLPQATAATAGVAVLHGHIYAVGGCGQGYCGNTSVYRYDPRADTWTQLADYPVPVASEACAGIAAKVVCAGGVALNNTGSGQGLTSTYIYDPASNTWTQGADMPYDDWGMAHGGANGDLQIADGITANSTEITNQAIQYNPATNAWTMLPNTNNAAYYGGGACGLYQFGGYSAGYSAQAAAQVLPGYDACGTVPWLSESTTGFELAPGQSVTVTVTLDSSAVPQPGTYSGKLLIGTGTPYDVAPLGITLQVNPPKTWGKIAGMVTDAATGNPIPGTTVRICTIYVKASGGCGPVTYTLRTDTSGYYQLWLNQGYNPLQVIGAVDGYQSQSKIVKITKGATMTLNFALEKT